MRWNLLCCVVARLKLKFLIFNGELRPIFRKVGRARFIIEFILVYIIVYKSTTARRLSIVLVTIFYLQKVTNCDLEVVNLDNWVAK